MMAVRAVNGCSIIRSSVYSPPSVSSSLLCCSHQFKPLHFVSRSKLGFFPLNCRFELHLNVNGGKFRFLAVHNFVDTLLEELYERRRRTSVAASNKLVSSKEILIEKSEKQGLQGGLLLEFKKDAERVLLAVVQKPDGKKNWMVSDQNGTMCSIKPQQITYVVPGVENFDHTQIPNFLQKAQENLDPSLLELAWAELLEKNKSVTPEELAEMIYGTAEPLESYCAHLLLSKGDMYFSMQESKRYCPVYAPRSSDQEHVKKVEVMKMHMLRWMCRSTLRDWFETKLRGGKFGVTSIANKLRENRLCWFGHVQWRPWVDA